ncbi:MAG: hypothetical protein GY832_41845 [Chloroflexi bacterium]|nr:hypothetical protein [Chloroflexota bacterium]
MTVNQKTRPNPYVGPRAFQTGEKLYGRDQEVMELLDLLIAERIVLLYSPSGAGKTSLVQASLVPQLEKEDFHVLPAMRVSLEPPPGEQNVPSLNRYILSLLLSLEKTLPPEEQLPASALTGMTLASYLDRRQAADEPEAQVLIFDQFEEILTMDPTDRAAKEEFFAQVGEVLRDRRRWALFAMREEYLAELDPYLRLLPTRLSTTYRLDLLGEKDALQAIQEPALQVGVDFDDTAARQLVDDLRQERIQQPDGSVIKKPGLHVEPVQLQVVCHRLWQNLPPGTTQIIETVQAVGDVDSALADYYADQIKDVIAQTNVNERIVREWFGQYLITERGIRGQVLQGHQRSKGLDNQAIWLFVDAHLVRAEERRGVTWFELAHDRMVEPIQKDNTAWYQANMSALQRQAALWDSQGRPSGLLLRDQALEKEEQWARDHPDEVKPRSLERAFLAASQQARQGEILKQNTRNRRLAIGATAFSVVLVILAVVAIQQSKVANQEREYAVTSAAAEATAKADAVIAADAEATARVDAEIAAATAVAAQQQAEIAADAEAEARQEAEEQRQIAKSQAMAARSELVVEVDLQLAILLGLEAVNETHQSMNGKITAEASNVLYNAMERSHLRSTFNAHTNTVNYAVWSSDDTRIVSASTDQTAKIWDAATGKGLLTLSGHTDSIQYVAWSADDARILTTSRDGSVRMWDAATGAELSSLVGHTEHVNYAAWSADGMRILTASDDGSARVWDAATSTELVTFSKHISPVLYAAWSAYDARIVTTGDDGSARIWDAATGEELVTFGTYTDTVNYAAWSSDNARIVTTGNDWTARVWDVVTGEELVAFIGHADRVLRAAWNSDDTYIATTSLDGSIKVWNAAKGVELLTISGLSAAWEPDGTRIAITSDGGNTQVWDVATREKIFILSGHSGAVESAAWNSNGTRIVTASADKSAKVWDIETSAGPLVLIGHTGPVVTAAWNPTDARIVTASADGSAKVWNTETGAELFALIGHTDRVNHTAWNSDGTQIVTASADGSAKVWDVEQKTESGTLSGHTGAVVYAAWSPDDTRIVTVSRDQNAKVWDAETKAEICTFDGHEGTVQYAAWNSDGVRIVTASADQTARVWDAVTCEELVTLAGHIGPVHHVAWSTDEARIVTTSADASAKVWDAVTGEELVPLNGHANEVLYAAWNSDDTYIVTASRDGNAKVWDTITGEDIFTLSGHTDGIQQAAWNSNDTRIVTASWDGSAKVWDVEASLTMTRGVELLTLSGHTDGVLHAAWSSDDARIVTASADMNARIHFAQIDGLGGLIEFACVRAGRNMTRDEWKRYIGYNERYEKTCPTLPE